MLSLEDPRWSRFGANYTDGRHVAALLSRAENGENEASWYDDLHQELCHQYTVSEAAYPAAPHLVRLAQSREELRKHLLLLFGVCQAFSKPPKLETMPATIVDEWRRSAEEALPLVADLLKHKQPNPSDLLYLLSTLAAVSGYPALTRSIEAVDYQAE